MENERIKAASSAIKLRSTNRSVSEFAKKLGQLHNKHSLFSIEKFKVQPEKNIINFLDDFVYLKEFYTQYLLEFSNHHIEQLKSNQACSVDLPFVGENVIKTGEAKSIFYFEGSLASTDKLSITVLSHLWLTTDKSIIKKFVGKGKWWTPGNYKNVKDKLNIPLKHLANSYITDSKRFNSVEKCSNLIEKEIKLLQPKLVVAIGNTAKNLVGMKYYDLPTKFHFVKFPKYHNDLQIYKELNMILNKI